MKLEDVKEQIDNYFDNVSADEIIKRFEKLGCEFKELPANESQFDHSILNLKYNW